MGQTRVCCKPDCASAGKPQPLDAKHFRPARDCRGGFRPDCRECEHAKEHQRRQRKRGAAPPKPEMPPEVPIDLDWPDDIAQAVSMKDAEPPADPLAQAYQQREKRDAAKEATRQRDALLDENRDLKRSLAALTDLRRPLTGPELLVYREPAEERSDAVACAVASDWHVEEEVLATSVHGLNEYNLDIAKARAERFFQNALRLARMMARESRITDLYLPILGDTFSGHIHDELKASTLLTPAKAARFVLSLLSAGIRYILKESDFRIVSDLIPGNHGRFTEQMWFSDPTGTSIEWLMYQALAIQFADEPRVRLNVCDNGMAYRRFFERFRMRLIHGYEVKYAGGVGGITIPINKALAAWNEPIRADLTVMGHFHQRFDGGSFIVNGSLIGYNTYAQAIKAKFEEPTQAFFLVHARRGGQKSIVAPIWLDDAHKDAPGLTGELAA